VIGVIGVIRRRRGRRWRGLPRELAETALTHVMLFDAPRFVDQALEDSANGVGVERGLGGFAQAIEQRAFAGGVVNGDAALALVFADLHDEPHSLVKQLEDLLIDRVDSAAQLIEFELLGHDFHPTHK
jgi:hypothetical protein